MFGVALCPVTLFTFGLPASDCAEAMETLHVHRFHNIR